jgi:hypothetical protein
VNGGGIGMHHPLLGGVSDTISASSSANFVILDPLNLANNTTKNSYLTKDILGKFQQAFNNLKSLMYKLPTAPQ